MGPLRRASAIGLAALALLAGSLAQPSPPQARANVACDVGGAITSPIGGIAGAIGIGPGNPVADACNAVTDPILGAAGEAVLSPLKEAAESVGKGIFNQVTSWVADGAVWLLGEVAELTQKTTSPNLLSKGFLHEYKLMAQIAVAMAALMAIFAVLEAIASGDLGMLGRIFLIQIPVAAIATSAAYVVVQMLLATCDGMCGAITQSTGADTHHFLQGSVKAIAIIGGVTQGTTGAVVVPLFIGFIGVCVAAFAAFFVWLELLMRDAAVYVVALFMPLALAASIWPRWVSALRRTAELLIVLVFSKFVIVAIIALAASLLANNEGSIEHVMAATVMLLLACFSPFVLFKLVPFAEGALSSAYGRQAASSAGVRTVELGNSMMMMRRLSRANWASAAGKEGGGDKGSGGGSGGGSSSGGGPTPGGEGAAGGAEAGAAGGAAAAGAVPVAAGVGAAKGARKAGERMGETGEAQAASESRDAGGGESPRPGGAAGEAPSRPAAGAQASTSHAGEAEPERPTSAEGGGAASPPRPEPSEASGGRAEASRQTVPRPQASDGGGAGGGAEAGAP